MVTCFSFDMSLILALFVRFMGWYRRNRIYYRSNLMIGLEFKIDFNHLLLWFTMFRLVCVFIAPDVGTGNWLTGVSVFFFRVEKFFKEISKIE